jgi:uncharacterized membrane protein
MTIFYLMFIAFIPFSTALIGEYGDQQISVIIYGINIIIVVVWAYLQWKYATKEHRLVDSDLDPKFIAIMSRRTIVGIILYAFAIAVSFLNTQVHAHAQTLARNNIKNCLLLCLSGIWLTKSAAPATLVS